MHQPNISDAKSALADLLPAIVPAQGRTVGLAPATVFSYDLPRYNRSFCLNWDIQKDPMNCLLTNYKDFGRFYEDFGKVQRL